MLEHIRNAGFPLIDSLIHLFVGGSDLHGAKSGDGLEDLDLYGVYVEPPEMLLGLQTSPHFVWSTASNDRKNVAGDVDITLYSLQKWAGLAAKGNPTALHFLFAPTILSDDRPTQWGRIVDYKRLFLSRRAAQQFIGFAEAQLGRLEGRVGNGKHGQRPELVEKFGYDTKAGMHVIRLLHECIELMSTGTITLPRPERELLIEVRNGGWSLDRLLHTSHRLFDIARYSIEGSVLPETVNREAISRVVAETYMYSWKGWRAKPAVMLATTKENT